MVRKKKKPYEPTELFDFHAPILIPSLKRYKKAKIPIMMIESCLNSIFKFYNATNIYVVAQEYTKEDKKLLKEKYPTVKWEWHKEKMGIINTFNRLKKVGCKLGDYYVHHDDDVVHSHQFSMNPTLLAMEYVMSRNLDRVGAVTVPSISIHHFKKAVTEYMSLHCNPAQLVMINSKAAKKCTYDERFANFRSDTDFTMQIANQGYLPVIINQFFSFMHTVPLSKIVYSKDGGRKFETLDNVNDTRGSIGGIRDMDNRKREYDQFQEKWPLVSTHKNYKQQLLKRQVVQLTKFHKLETVKIQDDFDFSLVRNFNEGYYGEEIANKYQNISEENKLFG